MNLKTTIMTQLPLDVNEFSHAMLINVNECSDVLLVRKEES